MPQYPRFEYSAPAYRSRYGDTIGQLLGLQGQRRAQEAIDAGQRSSNLWGGVNESIQNALGGYVNARDQQQQQARAQQRAAEDAEVRGFQLEGLREQRTTTANARARDDRYAQTVNQPKATRATILDGLKDDPELFDRASQTFSKIDQQHNRWLGEYAAGVRTLGENPESALLALADLEEQGYDPKKLAPFRQAITERPESVPDILDKILGASPDPAHQALVRPKPKEPKLQAFAADQDIYDTTSGTLVRAGQAKALPEPQNIEAALLTAQRAGNQNAVNELLTLRKRSAAAGRDPNANAPGGAQNNTPLVEAVLANPDLYADLTPTAKAAIGADLAARGFKQFGSRTAAKPPTGAQSRVFNFFERARQADETLEALEPGIQDQNFGEQLRMKVAPNVLQTQEGQSYTAAQRAFTEARLRKDSGAAIPPAEYDNDRKTYFAQPGDTPTTLAEKRRSRASILAALANESGNAFTQEFGDDADAVKEIYRKRSVNPITNRPALNVAPPSGGPRLNEERLINGQRAIWDGKGWLAR